MYKQAIFDIKGTGMEAASTIFFGGTQLGIGNYVSGEYEQFVRFHLTASNAIKKAILKELQYGVIPSLVWMSIGFKNLTINSVLMPIGTEILFKTGLGINCGFGVLTEKGFSKFIPIYADDPFEDGQTGPMDGNVVRIFVNGKECSETIIFNPNERKVIGTLSYVPDF